MTQYRLERIGYWTGIAILVWFLVTFLAVPLFETLVAAMTREGQFSLGAIGSDLAQSRRVRTAVWNTLWMTAATTITVTLFGVFQVMALEFFHLRGRGLFKLACAVPLVFGSVTAAAGYSFTYGPGGVVTSALTWAFPAFPRDWFIGWLGVLTIHSFLLTMFHFLFLRAAMRRVDYSMIEAARSMGASEWTILTRIVLPVLRPTLLAVTLLTVFYSLNSFAAPRVLGGSDFFMLNEIILTLNSLRRPDLAALLALILGAVVVVVLLASQHFEAKGSYTGGAKTPVPIALRRVRSPIGNVILHGIAYLMILGYLLPVALVVLFSFAPGTSIGVEILPSSLTIDNYLHVFSTTRALGPFLNSVLMGVMAVAIAVAFTLLAMPMIVRGRSWLARAMDFSFVLPWILPSPLIAIGFILAFDLSNRLVFGTTLLGSYVILPLCYVVTSLPLVARILRAAHVGIDPSYEEAARSLGAGGLYRYWRVVFPMVLPAVIMVSGLVFNDILSEYPVSAFLYNVNNRPLSIAIVDGARNPDPERTAINLVYVTLIMVFSLAIILTAERLGLGKGPKTGAM